MSAPNDSLQRSLANASGLKSPLDRAIVDLFLCIEDLPTGSRTKEAKFGMRPRDIRFALASYRPRKSEKRWFQWLLPLRRTVLQHGFQVPFDCSKQLLNNHLRRLVRIGVLEKNGDRYLLGANWLAPGEWDRVKRALSASGRQSVKSEHGVVFFIDHSEGADTRKAEYLRERFSGELRKIAGEIRKEYDNADVELPRGIVLNPSAVMLFDPGLRMMILEERERTEKERERLLPPLLV